jgi:uncharacterized radical SAM superfamily protein
MPEPNFSKVWEISPKKLLGYLNSGVLIPKPKIINFYSPSFASFKTKHYPKSTKLFQSFSITGNQCFLRCRHCEGKILRTMKPTFTPKKLIDASFELKKEGGIGCLISGGCQKNGSIAFKDFIPAIAKIKSELDLTIFIHTGIINFEMAKELKKAKVDLALIDVIGSENTLRKLGICLKTKNYSDSLAALEKADMSFVPHIIVGLDKEDLRSELSALEMISSTHPSAIVIIGFVPIHGTKMANIKPPNPKDIAKVLVATRLIFPNTAIALGCMRQKGKNRKITELYALKAGVTAITYPSEETIEYAKIHNYRIDYHYHCCARIYLDYI